MKNRVKVNYYDSFRCTADKCPYTCCQEWAITVDDETKEKWESLKIDTGTFGEVLQGEDTLCGCMEKDGEGYVIGLNENKMCPFLSTEKLCKLVVELGVEYSTEICRSYPRHISSFEDREEYSLDFGCPAVIDLLNEQEEIEFLVEEAGEYEISLLDQVREMTLEIMRNKNYSLTERMMITCHCLMELFEMGEITEEEIAFYTKKQYLDELVKELRKIDFDPSESFWERNEMFQDIIQIYRKEGNYTAYVEEIAIWSERLGEWYNNEQIIAKQREFENQYVEFENLFHKYLIAEIWASCMTEESTVEDMLMVFQWISLEYCSMKHAIFLKWISSDEKPLTYEDVREYIMIVSRMAGYDHSDIRNCLGYSFEHHILEWRYLAVVLGNGRV